MLAAAAGEVDPGHWRFTRLTLPELSQHTLVEIREARSDDVAQFGWSMQIRPRLSDKEREAV